MPDFKPCGGESESCDPFTRVNYSHGQVLGAEDFQDEQRYLRERDHLATRALHGFGIVSGLEVSVDDAGRLHVDAGLAIDPVGRIICVPTDQCADIAAWVAAHGELSSPGRRSSLWIVLCYRDVPARFVPTLGDGDQDGTPAAAASRIIDSFELELRKSPPVKRAPQTPCLHEEQACIALGRVDIEVTKGPSGLVLAAPPVLDVTGRSRLRRAVQRVTPVATVTPAGADAYEIWFHLDWLESAAAVRWKALSSKHLRIYRETDSGPPFLSPVEFGTARRAFRNVYRLRTRSSAPGPSLLQFRFLTRAIQVDVDGAASVTLADLASHHGVAFVGGDAVAATVTVPVLLSGSTGLSAR